MYRLAYLITTKYNLCKINIIFAFIKIDKVKLLTTSSYISIVNVTTAILEVL